MTNDILTTPALELGRRIAAREQSSTEVTGAFLDQIDAVEPAVHAFLAVDRDLALRRAGEVDAQIAAGERLS
ncbi:Asp-tRNA(Asn)/Glu-tRNA(Gln) amidotransferase GatCAB subunit A, partial [Propionibacterium freudenreichii]|nr:Asp-tRNA(Asn)/Glu-tRNA(Gln) amidotransferase GatCAB subunit A [Propionibacterium freudenreichii]MCT3007184.1 Asp-tRNA(Asn)/Glu-tRNA(Gln) amidotransferase GatCAB subunit A [Propionibacterium freudenreichii]